jgi:hypothetical protein
MAERETGYRRFRQIDTNDRDVASIADEIAGLWLDLVVGDDSPAKMDR